MTIVNFEEKLQKYAELIVKVGVNVQPGQEVVLYINVDQQHLAHLIVKEAYRAGAGKVMVKWNDTFTQCEFLKHASNEFLENTPEFSKEEAQYIADHRCCRISVISEDPGAFSGIDQKRVATYQNTKGKALMPVRQATQNNDLSWTVVAAASLAWAERVFPDLKGNAAVDHLWEEIFKTTRIDCKNPIQAWKDHDAKLHEKENWLNKEQFSALHYTSPRTDLTIGLPENHVWEGGGSKNAAGIEFMANMPTEECFTAPDNRRINGYVTSTKPLSYAGNILKNMKFIFKDGKVIEATAETGQTILDHLLETDEGVRSLGEVSLVPNPSPISQSGITFFNTLFDENASDHLALGAAYPFNIQGGTKMNEEQLKAKGINFSQAHVDFMIGSADMNIDGIKKDGTIVPVFRNGDWA